MNVIIATRKSKLAQVQTEMVMKLLKEKLDLNSEKLLIVTEGDRRLDVSLNKIGGKGLFVKDIELALLDGKAHCAVHSMKDVPYELDDNFSLIAMPDRDDIRDVFVSLNGVRFEELKKYAKIGTSSIRRAAQLKLLRPDLEIVPVRGNVQTRIKKIDEYGLDGIILAAAGLKRMNMEDLITDYFNPMEVLPAIGQGAIGIEVSKQCGYNAYFKQLDNKEVRIRVDAERSFMRALNGDCHSLIGCYTKIEGSDIYMMGTFMVNGKIVKKDIIGNKDNNILLGEKLAKKILDV